MSVLASDALADLDVTSADRTAAGVPRKRRRPTLVISGTVLAIWVVAAAASGHIEPFSPSAQSPRRKFVGPGWHHLFGTDGFGRDVFSRVLAGAQPVLTIAPLCVLLAVIAGTAIGLVTGYFGGLTDGIAMRVLDSVAVLPPLFPAVLAVALLGRSTTVLVVVLAFTFTPIVARTVRSATLVEREKQFVEAARLRGEGVLYILGREILPNITSSIVVEGTVRLADAVFSIATLAFVGLGAEPGSPDWGAQVADNRINLQFAWWTVVFPAVAVASLVIAVSLLADVIRERRTA
ncbi:MAG: ABC-type transporter, integral rane subunit [Ilumatobacteraceae bacterium]|nr:ABC-type transporter, integral rane subunit [Ilumatobacteraceae bacterium]